MRYLNIGTIAFYISSYKWVIVIILTIVLFKPVIWPFIKKRTYKNLLKNSIRLVESDPAKFKELVLSATITDKEAIFNKFRSFKKVKQISFNNQLSPSTGKNRQEIFIANIETEDTANHTYRFTIESNLATDKPDKYQKIVHYPKLISIQQLT